MICDTLPTTSHPLSRKSRLILKTSVLQSTGTNLYSYFILIYFTCTFLRCLLSCSRWHTNTGLLGLGLVHSSWSPNRVNSSSWSPKYWWYTHHFPWTGVLLLVSDCKLPRWRVSVDCWIRELYRSNSLMSLSYCYNDYWFILGMGMKKNNPRVGDMSYVY